jgi:DNA mismatch repair protein MutS
MMKQYLEVKEEYDDYVLLYRLGDFYECFFEDAVIVSRVLELTLTARDCGNGKRAAMCGVPYHKVDVHLGKLVSKGYKVAICEQVENPKEAAGLVKRDVVKVVTPGTVTDESILTNTKNNFLAAVCKTKEAAGLAFGDITTGEIFATTVRGEELISRVLNELNTYQPSELIINTDYAGCKELCDFSREKFNAVITETAKAMFAYEYTKEKVKKVFDNDSDKLTDAEGIMAVGALLIYASSTQKTEITFFRNLTVYSKGQYLLFDVLLFQYLYYYKSLLKLD